MSENLLTLRDREQMKEQLRLLNNHPVLERELYPVLLELAGKQLPEMVVTVFTVGAMMGPAVPYDLKVAVLHYLVVPQLLNAMVVDVQ